LRLKIAAIRTPDCGDCHVRPGPPGRRAAGDNRRAEALAGLNIACNNLPASRADGSKKLWLAAAAANNVREDDRCTMFQEEE
jgi:hypothetical protein